MRALFAILFAAALGAAPAGAAALELAVSGGARWLVPVTSLKQARFQRTVRQQYDFSCGSAALATLLTHHYDYPVSEQFVFERMYARGDQQKIRREGFSLLDIKHFLAEIGFQADGFQLPLVKLSEAGFPAIVLLAEHGYRHFVVVKGLARGRVLIGDPAAGTRALTQSSFEAMWQGGLLFVIHDRDGPVRFNAAADWRAAPAAPLAAAVERGGLDGLTMPKHGSGDF